MLLRSKFNYDFRTNRFLRSVAVTFRAFRPSAQPQTETGATGARHNNDFELIVHVA